MVIGGSFTASGATPLAGVAVWDGVAWQPLGGNAVNVYTLRVIAGAAVTGIVLSFWLLAFSMFMFLSLALVKRCAELVALGEEGRPSTTGRDYRVTDLAVLCRWAWARGCARCWCSASSSARRMRSAAMGRPVCCGWWAWV